MCAITQKMCSVRENCLKERFLILVISGKRSVTKWIFLHIGDKNSRHLPVQAQLPVFGARTAEKRRGDAFW